jgi:hypothetical protein
MVRSVLLAQHLLYSNERAAGGYVTYVVVTVASRVPQPSVTPASRRSLMVGAPQKR